MSRVVHFELAADDPERAVKFYEGVFGWQIKKWEGPQDYWLAATGAPGTPGIDGAIMRRDPGMPAVVNTIDVTALDEMIAAVKANGGTVGAQDDRPTRRLFGLLPGYRGQYLRHELATCRRCMSAKLHGVLFSARTFALWPIACTVEPEMVRPTIYLAKTAITLRYGVTLSPVPWHLSPTLAPPAPRSGLPSSRISQRERSPSRQKRRLSRASPQRRPPRVRSGSQCGSAGATYSRPCGASARRPSSADQMKIAAGRPGLRHVRAGYCTGKLLPARGKPAYSSGRR